MTSPVVVDTIEFTFGDLIGYASETDTTSAITIDIGCTITVAVISFAATVYPPGAVQTAGNISAIVSTITAVSTFPEAIQTADLTYQAFPFNAAFTLNSIDFSQATYIVSDVIDLVSAVNQPGAGESTDLNVLPSVLNAIVSISFDRPRLGIPIMAGEQLYAITVASGNE